MLLEMLLWFAYLQQRRGCVKFVPWRRQLFERLHLFVLVNALKPAQDNKSRPSATIQSIQMLWCVWTWLAPFLGANFFYRPTSDRMHCTYTQTQIRSKAAIKPCPEFMKSWDTAQDLLKDAFLIFWEKGWANLAEDIALCLAQTELLFSRSNWETCCHQRQDEWSQIQVILEGSKPVSFGIRWRFIFQQDNEQKQAAKTTSNGLRARRSFWNSPNKTQTYITLEVRICGMA